jgi:hypothetical protein
MCVTTADLAHHIIPNPALPGFLLSGLPLMTVCAADLARELHEIHYGPALLRYTAVCVCHYLLAVHAGNQAFPAWLQRVSLPPSCLGLGGLAAMMTIKQSNRTPGSCTACSGVNSMVTGLIECLSG